ncbi:MAG: ferredoxin--nitrite reductase, partial [Acidimicrobiales bacterium]|nr:ferredoxin--nitrite reductase [Acidimicrobiales bacterium]
HLTRRYRGDHVGLHPQKQPGLSYLGVSVTVGRLIAEEIIEIGRLAKVYGDGDIRLTTDQNFVLSGIANDKVEALLEEELLVKHSPFPGPFTRGAIACTGSEFCRFAVVETKERIIQWAKNLDDQFGERLGSVDASSVVRMHFSGCPASCAQPQIADIGFRGDTAHQGDQIVEAVDIGLGGSLGGDAGFIDWIKGAHPVEDVPSALSRVIERYLIEKKPDERLATWARRTPTESLSKTLLPKEED